MTPVLRSDRLLLEPYAPEDEADFMAFFADTRVSRWIGNVPDTEDGLRDMFWRVFTKVYETGAFDVWAVRENGALIGHAEIKPTDAVPGGHELVYALAEPAWGRGLGTELARAIVEYGFDAMGLDAVHATVDSQNAASLAVMRKVGFAHVRDKPEDDDGHVTRVLTLRRPPNRPS